ncbi:MAG: hypothetical protein ACI8ZA_002591, partial [Gammaproteobacteria bacterium]
NGDIRRSAFKVGDKILVFWLSSSHLLLFAFS